MKKFIKYIAALSICVIAIMALLDFIYTNVYEKSNPRNKIQYILNLKPRKIDYIFLGSSRVANTIVTDEIIKASNKTAINLGIEGAVLSDNLLQLKLLLNNGIVAEKIFLQVDDQYENLEKSAIAKADAIPFIHNSIIKEHLKEEIEDFSKMYHIPFYRYMVTDYKVGFRELFFSITDKKPKVNLDNGFSAKKGNHELETIILPKIIAKNNSVLEKIRLLCDQNNIELVLFCAPFCSNTQNIDYVDKLQIKLPKMQNYSRVINDSLFFNCDHLNVDGAMYFTKLFIEKNRLNANIR